MPAAKIGPNRFHHIRTVSWQMSSATLEQQILDVPQGQREAHVYQHRQADHLGLELNRLNGPAGSARDLRAIRDRDLA